MGGARRPVEGPAASLLEPLGPAQRERLLAAMSKWNGSMRASTVSSRPPIPWRQAARLHRGLFPGTSGTFRRRLRSRAGRVRPPGGGLVPLGWFLITQLEGAPAGCGALKSRTAASARSSACGSRRARGRASPSACWKPSGARAADAGVSVLRGTRTAASPRPARSARTARGDRGVQRESRAHIGWRYGARGGQLSSRASPRPPEPPTPGTAFVQGGRQ